MNNNKKDPTGIAPAGSRISMVSNIHASQGDNHFRPIMLDGRGIRITAQGLFYGIVHDSDTYVLGSIQFNNGRPIYLAKGRTPEEDDAIHDLMVDSGIQFAHAMFLTDGRGMRITAEGMSYGIIRDSDTYVLGSIDFNNGCPIFTAKGETLEEDAAIVEMEVYLGVYAKQLRLLRKKQNDNPDVGNRLAKIPEGEGLEDLAKRNEAANEREKEKTKRCWKEVKKAVKRHASPETIEELRREAHRHAVLAKEYQKAARLMQPLVVVVAKARGKKAERTSRMQSAIDRALYEARRAEHTVRVRERSRNGWPMPASCFMVS